MSDDEFDGQDAEGADGAQHLNDGYDDDDECNLDDALHPLPDGIQKKLIKKAPVGCHKKPKKGEEVLIHYVGRLASDGKQFNTSRDAEEPIKFALGQGQVIKGWDLAVATMKKGEVAKFTLDAEFVNADFSSNLGCPTGVKVIFEIELIRWFSREYLFGDASVVKIEVEEGTGWKKPKEDDEILVSYKVSTDSGVVKDEKQDLAYLLGTQAAGPLSKAMDKALLTMTRGEACKLTCKSRYLYDDGEDGVVDLTLHEIFETKDVSWAKDESVMKKRVKEGEGKDTPRDSAKVKITLQDVTAAGTSVLKDGQRTLEFVLGNGEYCDIFECACAEMKQSEEAYVICNCPELAVDEKLGLPAGMEMPIVARLTMDDFERVTRKEDMIEDEKMAFAADRKEVATNLFKAGRIRLACQRYDGLVLFFGAMTSFKPEGRKKEAEAMKRICRLNKAACCLKLGDPRSAKFSCTEVLKDEKYNIKALFRRAQANVDLKDFEAAITDLKLLLEQEGESTNAEAKRLLVVAQKRQKEEDKKQKGMYSNMCNALGKMPQRKDGPQKKLIDEAD
eukprot:gnl/MRDRNA2_/MRDRNA2_33912_c0_seq1.p1 gnl/MRDRNA2_/MRDRNA2_33912_c0~~gnl/MRDRNA2_/MRDRNA2_33912_c0_seq1.p1  ORF type:complete len:561 (+),score=158.97 gnl/MRDRNA2_/MRDRNA2_33912_c0_seq1:75-1757(+)